MRALVLTILGLLVASSALALDPAKHVSQYGHMAWRVQDGSIPEAVNAIAQTADGYIWIATDNGLLRFDGAKFVPFAPSVGEPLRNPGVVSLFADRDGSLWIGTYDDLEHWQGGQLTHYPKQKGFHWGLVTRILRSRDGALWLGRARLSPPVKPLCTVNGESLLCFGRDEGVQARFSFDLVEGKDGTFWFCDDASLYHWDPKTQHALPGGLTGVGNVDSLQALTLDTDGSVLMAMEQSDGRLGLARDRDGHLEPFKAGSLEGHQFAAHSAFRDSSGDLWIGTYSNGLYRVRSAQVDHYGAADGLSGETVNKVFEDREGDIWVATSEGLDRFRDMQVSTYSTHEGLSADNVHAVLAASDGTIWVSNAHALDAMHSDGTVTSLRGGGGKELPGQTVTALLEDRKHRIWVGIDDALQILEGGRFRKVEAASGQERGRIGAMVEDREGGVWVLESNDRKPYPFYLHLVDDKLQEQITHDQLPVERNASLAADPQEGVWLPLDNGDIAYWKRGKAQIFELHHGPRTLTGLVALPSGLMIASTAFGITVIRDGQMRQLTTEQGLPCARMWSMTTTDEALWLYSACGAIELKHSELERWWRDPNVRPQLIVLDALDGARPGPGIYAPLSSSSPDGRVWFANGTVLQMIDPRTLSHQPVLLPPVLIEQLLVDGKAYSTSGEIIVPPLSRQVEIDYTSPSFAIPQRVHFRYALDGLEQTWLDSGNRRQAFFDNLAPGAYRFRVSAAAADSPWSADSVLNFRVQPKFYQTTWFRLLCVLAGICTVMLLVRWRIEAVGRNLRARWQARMDERERIARDLHDTLFQNVQGLFLAIDNSTNTLPEEHPTRLALKHSLERSDEVMSESRERVLDLRSEALNRDSIANALSRVGNELSKVYSPAPAFRVAELGTPERLHPFAFDEVFHICREALFNAFRHSRAQHIEAEILFERHALSIRIRDDGVGIDERVLRDGIPGHFGLKGMRERARAIGAQLSIRSKPGAGTEIELSIPKGAAVRSPRKP